MSIGFFFIFSLMARPLSPPPLKDLAISGGTFFAASLNLINRFKDYILSMRNNNVDLPARRATTKFIYFVLQFH
mgnify:CR=1 FL=1